MSLQCLLRIRNQHLALKISAREFQRGRTLTNDNVGLGSRLLHELGIVEAAKDKLGVGVLGLDGLGLLLVADQEGEVEVRVRLRDVSVRGASDVAFASYQ